MSDTRIGISGWTYAPWRGTFYPADLKHREELAYASRQLNSIEINGTFYSLQRPESFAAWAEQTPEDFVFSIKGGRYITHMRKLRDVEVALANFFASGVLRLGRKLGPILWQLPPNLGFNSERMETFLALLPRTTAAAAELAHKRDERLQGREWLETDVDRPIRYAIEVRHETFRDATFIALLRRHRVALCVADTAGKWPYMEDVTADFVYCRLHGDKELYVSGYSDAALDAWAAKARIWRSGGVTDSTARVSDTAPPRRRSRDVYVYFDNDVKVRAPYDAMNLARRLGVPAGQAGGAPPQDVQETARSAWPAVRARRPLLRHK